MVLLHSFDTPKKGQVVLWSIFCPPLYFKVAENLTFFQEWHLIYSHCTIQLLVKQMDSGLNYDFWGPQTLNTALLLHFLMTPLKFPIAVAGKLNGLWTWKFQDFHISSIATTTRKKKKIQHVLRCTSLELTWNGSWLKSTMVADFCKFRIEDAAHQPGCILLRYNFN